MILMLAHVKFLDVSYISQIRSGGEFRVEAVSLSPEVSPPRRGGTPPEEWRATPPGCDA